LARWLREAGHEAQHVADVGLRDAEDAAIWAYALRTDVVVVTKDEDFAASVARVTPAPVIVWLRVGNATNAALLAWLGPRLPGVVQLVEQGSRLVEVV
jgi:predicted nuclease of predicted toxin-antitoxin system